MPGGFGVEFFPKDPSESGGPSEQERYQQAIQVLGLRLPKFPAGNVLAPAPLLQNMGGQGQPFARSGLGQTQGQRAAMGAPPMTQAFAQMAGVPMPQTAAGPRIVPGIDPIPPTAPQIPSVQRPPTIPTPIAPENVQGGPYLPMPENATPFPRWWKQPPPSGGMFEA